MFEDALDTGRLWSEMEAETRMWSERSGATMQVSQIASSFIFKSG